MTLLPDGVQDRAYEVLQLENFAAHQETLQARARLEQMLHSRQQGKRTASAKRAAEDRLKKSTL